MAVSLKESSKKHKMATKTKKTTTKPTPAVNPVVKQIEAKTIRYLDKNVKMSPRKLRLIANLVKKMKPQVALNHLQIANSRSSRILTKAIKTAIADATSNHNLVQDSLVFTSILVGQGIKYKRMDKSHSSRFSRGLIQKRHSRLTINISGTKN